LLCGFFALKVIGSRRYPHSSWSTFLHFNMLHDVSWSRWFTCILHDAQFSPAIISWYKIYIYTFCILRKMYLG
jgi:hypothetical protein